MKCPKCNSSLKKAEVAIQGAMDKAICHQCPNCDYFEFEGISSEQIIEELRELLLKIK